MNKLKKVELERTKSTGFKDSKSCPWNDVKVPFPMTRKKNKLIK